MSNMGKSRVYISVLILQAIFYRCQLIVSALNEPQRQGPPSPFTNVKGEYDDWQSEAMELQARYCGNGCQDRFNGKTYPNPKCDPCYCDDDCYIYDDCCPDKVVFEKSKDLPKSKGYGCTQTTFSNEPKFSKVIDVCPSSYVNFNVINDCLNKDSKHWQYVKPATDLTTNITYRNKFCAECNGAGKIQGWSTESKCRSSTDYGDSANTEDIYFTVINNYRCSLIFNPSVDRKHLKRSCNPLKKPLYTKCNETGRMWIYDREVERACELYTSVVDGKYKNLFCRLCNEFISWEQLLSEPDGSVAFAKYSFDALLDLDNDDRSVQTSQRTNKLNQRCSVDEELDPVSCGCLKKTCSQKETLVDGECKSIFEKSNNNGYQIQFCVDGTYSKTEPNTDKDAVLFNYLHNTFPDWRTTIDIVTDIQLSPVSMSQCDTGLIDMKLQGYIKVFFAEIVNTDEKQKSFIDKVLEIGTVTSKNGYNVTASLGKCEAKTIFESVPMLPASRVPTPTCIPISVSPVTRTPPLTQADAHAADLVQFVDLTKLMTCTQILVNQTATTLIGLNVKLIHNNVTLTNGEYGLQGERYAVCREDYLEGTNATVSCPDEPTIEDSGATPLGITSVVCSCVSLFFLIVSFVFYCVVSQLRNVVGVNVMGLIVTLFFAQLFYEFGLELTDYPDLCQAMGILIHYFWLSATFWMNACTFVLFYKLSFPLSSRGYGTKHVFKRCLFYSMLSPLVIVGVNLIVNFATDGTSGYGGNHSCYIQSVDERRFAFALPLGVLILVNIGLFTFTFVKIRSTQMESAINRENKINIMACLKLSVITGALWIFVFIYEATKAVVFAYLFTVLIGFQGVLLFFAFIVNKRVCQSCAETIGASEHSESSSSKQKKYRTKSTTDSNLSSVSATKIVGAHDGETGMLVKDKDGNIHIAEGSV